MGELLGITPQSVKETEQREGAGTISLNILRRYAMVLKYKLVYKFVKCDNIKNEEEKLDDLSLK